jgi:hypothetical protein
MVSTPPSRHISGKLDYEGSSSNVAYMRPTALMEINTGLGWKSGRRFTKLIAPQNRSNNTYIRQSRLQIYIGQMRQRRTLHTNKRGNTSKGNNNYQPICTQYQFTQFHLTCTKRLKSKYRLQYSGGGRL